MRSIDEANKCRLGRETSRGDINTNEGGGGRPGKWRAGEGNTALYCLLSHSGDLLNELTEICIYSLQSNHWCRQASQCLC